MSEEAKPDMPPAQASPLAGVITTALGYVPKIGWKISGSVLLAAAVASAVYMLPGPFSKLMDSGAARIEQKLEAPKDERVDKLIAALTALDAANKARDKRIDATAGALEELKKAPPPAKAEPTPEPAPVPVKSEPKPKKPLPKPLPVAQVPAKATPPLFKFNWPLE